ncbi:MAG: hypothetical protein R3F59_20730 [Myxococcota bacterium]
MGWELVLALVLVGVAAAAAGVYVWRRPPALPEAPSEARPEAIVPEIVDDEDDAPQLPVPVRRPPREGAGWVAALSTAAPIAALGLFAHHRRYEGYHRHKGADRPGVRFGAWLRNELPSFGVLGWWHVRGLLPAASAAEPVRRPVLCIHGYSQNGTNFFGLRRVLSRAGHPTSAVSLGHLLAPMSWYAGRLERQLERFTRAHPDGFDVVAHSMGGVVLRMVLHRRPALREAVCTVVTLGSPHRGTAAARGIPLLPEVRALRRSSPILRDLPQLPELLPHARIVTVAGDHDTVVYPVDTALVDETEQVVLKGIGHAGLLTHPRSLATVRRALAGPPGVH